MKKTLLVLVIATLALKTFAQNKGIISQTDTGKIFTTNIDIAPEYKGGMDKFYTRLAHITYTFYDRISNHSGLVTVIMVIEKDGSISNLKILHGLSEVQDKQIYRAVRALNKWKPGIVNGQPVRVLCSIPINFELHQLW